jgi:uncharacterized protein
MLEELFGSIHPIIGVVHLQPLPGSPRWDGQMEPIFQRAEQEAVALTTGGVDGIIVENFFDAPFKKDRLDPVTVAAFALAVKRVMVLSDVPIGINCLRNDGLSAIALAVATGAQFIRVNVFTGAMVTDQGIIEGPAHELLMYRRLLQAQKHVKIFADVLVKHATAFGASPDIVLAAKDAYERGLADALIVTGSQTGEAADLEDLRRVRSALPTAPLLVGSGCNKENISELLDIADGAIVASSLKREGLIHNPVDVERVNSLIAAARVKQIS